MAASGPLRSTFDGLTRQPPAGRARIARARETADAIAGYVADSDGFVVMVPSYRRPDLAQLYLPFLVGTTELYVADPGRRRDALDLLAGAPTREERSFGEINVKKTEYLGRKTSVISFPLPIRGTAAPLPPRPPGRPGRRPSPPSRDGGSPPAG
jgi:hypothetical protein